MSRSRRNKGLTSIIVWLILLPFKIVLFPFAIILGSIFPKSGRGKASMWQMNAGTNHGGRRKHKGNAPWC